jgi:DNA-binding NarL/FixJ family response regulator
MNDITIILADDHPIVRKGLCEVIEEESNFIVLAEVNNGQEAIEAIERFSPMVAVRF